LVGNYSYSFNDQASRSVYSVLASLDSNSILKDKYIESGDGNEKIVEYKDGFWSRIINKNLQTGKVEIKVNEAFTKQEAVFSDFLKAKIANPNLEESAYKIGGYNGTGDAGYDRLNDVIGKTSDMFIFLNIGGDLTMERIKNRGLWAFITRTVN